MNEENRRIGQRLRDFRKEKGYSITTAARHINVSPAFISMVENGKSGISFNRIHQLVELYGKSLADLTETEKLDARIINLHTAPVVAQEKGVTIYGLAQKTNGVHLGGFRMCFEPGACHAFDFHNGFEYALILEGRFQLRLKAPDSDKAEVYTLNAGDTTIYPSNTLHQWKNIGEKMGTFFVIEANRRE